MYIYILKETTGAVARPTKLAPEVAPALRPLEHQSAPGVIAATHIHMYTYIVI